MFWEY